MKVGILSEWHDDEAVYKTLVETILGHSIEIAAPQLRRRSGGWRSTLGLIPSVMTSLYWSGVQGFVCVVDCDGSPIHKPEHDDSPMADCRLCQLNQAVHRALTRLSEHKAHPPLRVAIGVAAPSIEAWLLAGVHRRCTEAWYRQQQESNRLSAGHRREVKELKYGHLNPARDKRVAKATKNAHRLANNLDVLRQRFQVGFGRLEKDLRSWSPS